MPQRQLQKKVKPKSKVPSKIKLFGKTITVQRQTMKEHEFGEYLQHRYLININSKLDDTAALQTLFHEILHASLHISGVSQLIPQSADTDSNVEGPDLEEAIVVCLENALSDFINIEQFRVE